MKKYIALMLALSCVLLFGACASPTDEADTTTGPSTELVVPATRAPTQPSTEPEGTTESTTKASTKESSTKAKSKPSTTKPTAKPDTTGKMTLAKYNQIKEGMTYEQVCKIVGGPGELVSEIGEAGDGHYFAGYAWEGYGKSGSTAGISFKNGIVTGKTQYGLK